MRTQPGDSPPPRVGVELTLSAVSAVAGGACLARTQGRVAFLRGAIPGETVRARVTGHGNAGRFVRAQVLEVLEPSPDRVEPPCPVAGICGGCDWQHVLLAGQRRLKAEVIADALRRTGGLTDIAGVALPDAIGVEAADDGDGLGWRTRMRYATDSRGRPGLRMAQSHQVVAAPWCPLAADGIRELMESVAGWPPDSEISVALSESGQRAVSIDPPPAGRDLAAIATQLPADVALSGYRGKAWLRESAAGRAWRVHADGFWQVHPRAGDLLTDTVTSMCASRPGERVLDLYSGVGLFAGCLAEHVGLAGRVDAVESDPHAAADARRNLHDLSQVHLHQAATGPWLAANAELAADVVVLDPPRAGAGREVAERIAAVRPRAVGYVACDPVALARDVATFAGSGYSLREVRCFDLFPMTKHVECVALLTPT